MNFIVGRIPGEIRIDPDAGGQGRQRKRERSAHKTETGDSVSISEEARRRSAQTGETDPEDPPTG
jgi:hypothetical protein